MADATTTCSSPSRATVETVRHHQRFLLRQMRFNEQFASMYRVRTKLLRERVMEKSLAVHKGRVGTKTAQPPEAVRVLGLVPGVESLVVGTLYKNMKNFVGFLAEYQKELVRIEAGDDEDGEGGMDDGGMEDAGALEAADTTADLARQSTVANPNSLCNAKDNVVLEDESGRVELTGIDPDKYVTGMVVAVYGTLMEKGRFEVKDLFFPGTPEAPLRAIPSSPSHTPCYVAFVCGLNIGSQGEAPLALTKLMAYLVGDTSVYSSATGTINSSVPSAASIAKLIVGGNIVEATDEQRLKHKVRLDPSDHVKIADTSNKLTAANSMKSADGFLSVLADSIDLDIMPGDNDPSNAYLPQQPLHPVLLRLTSKKPSARFVTNPYEVALRPSPSALPETRLFITSGQNVEDLLRQTNHSTALSAMETILECGCACPTAPNTLLCYPFVDKDPFTMAAGPHVMVSCNAKAFETRLAGGVRFVTVPSFASTGTLVLCDIASPNMDTVSVVFTV